MNSGGGFIHFTVENADKEKYYGQTDNSALLSKFLDPNKTTPFQEPE